MALTDQEIRKAEAAMQAEMAKGPRAVAARYDRRRGRVVVRLDNGLELAFPPGLAEGLGHGSPAELSEIEISPTGLGLHWPRLDADLYLPGLLRGVLGSRRWMAGLMGRQGGRARTEAKAAAARVNGQRGGRPRKVADARGDS
jgi:Protein of unknown function (DUF2442)